MLSMIIRCGKKISGLLGIFSVLFYPDRYLIVDIDGGWIWGGDGILRSMDISQMGDEGGFGYEDQ